MATYLWRSGDEAGGSSHSSTHTQPAERWVHTDFIARTLDFAISPHKERHQFSAASDADDKVNAWQWIYDQVSTGVRDPE